jgi:zinc/manganese transport system substrate-binding protein
MLARCRVLTFALVTILLVHSVAYAQDQGPGRIKVVATFSILADLARNVGGERTDVTSLVGANGDVHVYTPSPADAKAIADAKIVIINGLGLEGWIDRLIGASGTKATIVTATSGVTPRQVAGADHGRTADPHAWQSVDNAKIYVADIRNALVKTDPAGGAIYDANARAYLAKLDALDREVRSIVARIPSDRRKVITTHSAFRYFGATYGVEFIALEGLSTESESSAKDVARIITRIKGQKIPAVFLENVTDPRLLDRIARETGAKIGGTLYSDALTDAKGQAPTYIDAIRHNARELAAALTL